MKKLFTLILALACGAAVQARVELPAVLGSGMVLQRNTQVNLWGKAEAGRKVTITASWTKQKFQTKADADGRWATQIPTTEAGGPYTLTFDDGEKTTLTDILLGEVWICSGQSNMEMPVGGFMYQPVDGSAEQIEEAASYPGIRMFTVPRCVANEPQPNCDTVWMKSTPHNVRTFSAIAYFHGKALHQALGVPVGLVTANWGGTVIEAWMSREALDGVEGRDTQYDKGRGGPNANSVLYNGMLHPLIPFTAKGFIWYQGCSNRYNYFDYARLQKALIAQWRSEWGQPDMPFYMVQIAPYCYEKPEYRRSAAFVDTQWQAAAETPHCGVVCTTDLGEYGCIHPSAKVPVGRRLANLALTHDYGVEGLPVTYPRFKSFEQKGDKLVLSFSYMSTPNNYTVKDPTQQDSFDPRQAPTGFEVAGADRKFYPARGQHIFGSNTIEVWSDSVPQPVAVRYAYHNYTPGGANVRTILGLPLVPFRSDNWEITDLGN